MVQERLEQLIRERRLEERCRRQQQSRIRERTKFVVMVAIEKCSYDPRENFRESMMEMITADHIKEARDLAYSAGSSFMEALEGELTQLGAIDDIEKLREYLEILEWYLEDHIKAHLLLLTAKLTQTRRIFLLRKKDIDWFYEGGAVAIFRDI
ncbi:proline iminopeptidase isoform X6 [Arachis hypogaea]